MSQFQAYWISELSTLVHWDLILTLVQYKLYLGFCSWQTCCWFLFFPTPDMKFSWAFLEGHYMSVPFYYKLLLVVVKEEEPFWKRLGHPYIVSFDTQKIGHFRQIGFRRVFGILLWSTNWVIFENFLLIGHYWLRKYCNH